ncbi:Dihydrofolate reductase [Channa argus]|uniref:dihydrofolate reductase n=1 Tax=Channa argus TaxID=215402 RepID=A0A6G1PFR3_CHAAH|nr:Dihydrofolate reductase [Channa argus]
MEMEKSRSTVQKKPIRVIAAVCNNMGIGKDGKLPWDLPTVPDHAHFLCKDFESAVHMATKIPLANLIETIWIVGGTQVYKDALKHPWCDLVYLTDIMADFDCDTFFPEFDKETFKLQQRFPGVTSEIQEEKGIKYKFQVYKKEIGDDCR